MVALTLAGDQATKLLICASLDPADSIPLIPSVLHLTYVQNTGAAFGLWRGYRGVFVLVSVIIAAWVFLELLQRRDRRWPIPLGLSLVLGGALGNLVDRVRVGYVIDFLDVRVWPVFNVADSAISVGVGLLLLSQTVFWRRRSRIKSS